MPDRESQSGFHYRNGYLWVENGALHFETQRLKPLRRHYRQHKLIVATLCVSALFIVVSTLIGLIVDPGIYLVNRERAVRNLIIIGVPVVAIAGFNLYQSTFTLETPIELERVNYVSIRSAKGIRSPRFRIVYDDESQVRQVYMDMHGFGAQQQFETGKRVLRDHSIPLQEE
ncbi:hypothetical protein ACFPYI_14770 [Halomarina salina]|uniref:PH domain-containing protein n=1 Tax=Halomarina salina TaxID=1872699 RepID=A0ABD5RQL0_9EURY|nr:hypothetical protein [Halomarina salina]